MKKTWSDIVNNLENVFAEKVPTEPLELRSNIEDIQLIEGVESEENSELVIFSQLSNYFEIGFLFVHQYENQWKSSACFVNGQVFLSDGKELTLPQIKADEVKKGRAASFLQKLNIRHKDPLRKLSTLMFQPNSKHAFVLLTKTAEPWLILKAEKLNQVFDRILT